jgi:hypothetical protein
MHDKVALVIEAARIVSNETGFWWELAAADETADESAFWFVPTLWGMGKPFPAPI